MLIGEPLSVVNVRPMVCDVDEMLATPITVVQFDAPCGPLGAKGKSKVDGAPETAPALVRPMSGPPGKIAVTAALSDMLAVIETKRIPESSLRSPKRNDAG